MKYSDIKTIPEQDSAIRKAALVLIENANCEFGESVVVSATDLQRLKSALMGERESS